MIYLLLGNDDYSKKEFLKELQTKERVASIDYFYEWQQQQIHQAFGSASLFEKNKIIAVYDQIGKFDFEPFIESVKSSANILVFLENALDRRKTETKKILTNKNIKVLEFEIPLAVELRKWIESYAKKIGLKIQAKALDLFIEKLSAGSERQAGYDLWQVSSELSKLKTFAGTKEINVSDVQSLATDNIDEDVFKITNAIADKNKNAAINSLINYLDRIPGIDEKSKIISLSAILAEQLRGILLIQSLLSSRVAEPEVIKQTGYSSGRFFIYKKIAKNFKSEKIFEALRKIELLDEEMKTSTGPAGLQFLMIVNSMLI